MFHLSQFINQDSRGGGGGGGTPPVIQNKTVNIYTGGSTIDDTASYKNTATTPYNMYYNYSVCHVFVSASEINATDSGAKIITGVDIENGVTGTASMSSFRISVAHTTEIFLSTLMETDISQSSSFTYSGRQTCFDSIYFPSGNSWNTVNFSNNFTYDGTSNLVITFENRSGSYNISGRPKWKYGARGLSWRAALFQDDYDNITTGSFPMITTSSTTASGNFPNLKINY